jgi:hypothetical protein
LARNKLILSNTDRDPCLHAQTISAIYAQHYRAVRVAITQKKSSQQGVLIDVGALRRPRAADRHTATPFRRDRLPSRIDTELASRRGSTTFRPAHIHPFPPQKSQKPRTEFDKLQFAGDGVIPSGSITARIYVRHAPRRQT